MKKYLLNRLAALMLVILTSSAGLLAEKIAIPFAYDGAWTYNSQPSAVYHNGKAFYGWISVSGNLVVTSYDTATGDVYHRTISSGYGTYDLNSPALLVRKSGQILVFASKNNAESNMQAYHSNSTTGDLSEGFTSSNLTGYGISATTAYAMGNHIVVFWRSKNNFGYTFYKDANTSDKTGNLSAGGTKRTGFIGDPGFGNNYQMRDEVPTLRSYQDDEGNVHLAVTQLGTGLKFSNSTIHYLKAVVANDESGIVFKTALGDEHSSINYNNPPDVVYATTTATDKAIAYDITLIDGKPAILYDAFNGNNVNAAIDPGETSDHTYKIAKWDGSDWVSNTVVNAGEGLPITEYNAVGKTFFANSYMSGGASFKWDNPYSIYLSKKISGGSFEIFEYTSTDNGVNWTEAAQLTSGAVEGEVNIRPKQIRAPLSAHGVDLLWMKGSYTNPREYNTSIVSLGEVQTISSLSFMESEHYLVVDEEKELPVQVAPLYVASRDVILESDNSAIVEVLPNGNVKALAVGTATITAKAVADNSITATSQVIVEEVSVFDIFMERIVTEALADRISSVASLDSKVNEYLSMLQSNGSFPDVNYKSTVRTEWPPIIHLNRLLEMALAYVYEGSSYYHDTDFKETLDTMLSYYQSQNPHSTNWYQNEIGDPQRIGLYLILIEHAGAEKTPEALFTQTVNRMRSKGGNPGSQAGANRVDVALHWMYRACLTQDRELLETAMDFIYSPIVYTSGSEGIQHDNSYTQHGRQLHIGSYGEVFLEGITKAVQYAVATPFALPEDQLAILSGLVKDSYVNVFRGGNIFFNVIGRASTRPNATIKKNSLIAGRMALIDSQNAAAYEAAVKRISGEETPDYQVTAGSVHYYKTDYALHRRPEYSVDLRMVSTRTARNEYLKDNLEGKKQYFLSDGAMGIFVKGDEYANIFHAWDWTRIPGTTVPQVSDIPQANTYIKTGQSNFVGGVSDSIYTVSTYQYKDNEYNLNSSANKSYFFFDNEIVCLGSGIQSSSDYKLVTTLNQAHLDGNITVSKNNVQTTLSRGIEEYTTAPEWVYHAGVGYYFPKGGNLELSATEQSGSWFDINGNHPADVLSKDVFMLSLDHGLQPSDDKYAYIIVPGLENVAEAQNYDQTSIDILVNSDSQQVVYNNKLGVYGYVFHEAGGIKANGVTVEVDRPCVVILKDADKATVIVHVADPSSGNIPIKIGVETPLLGERRLITYVPSAPYLGNTQRFELNEDSPVATGMDILIDRSDWIITTSIEGAADSNASIGGDDPYYIIDGDENSSFLFVKPGRSFGGVTAPSDYIPSFTINMQEEQEFSYINYMHRTLGSTQSSLRAHKISFYVKSNEEDEFVPVLLNHPIATNVKEVRVDLPETVFAQYVKLEIVDWDTAASNTIQVAEFNMGAFVSTEYDDITTSVESHVEQNDEISVWPNPVTAGEVLNVKHSGLSDKEMHISVFDINGRLLLSRVGNHLATTGLSPGLYFLRMINEESSIVSHARLMIK